jgi:mono/diheme cytochrome c family protein
MVPDLRNLKHPTDAAHWRQWIATSKPGSLMPAFGKAFDGPLSDAQIDSLVEYLSKTMTAGSQPRES